MPTILKTIVIILSIAIVSIIGYIVYLYKQEMNKDQSADEQKPEKKQKTKATKPIKAQRKPNPSLEWEVDLLISITKERLARIRQSTTKKLDMDELEVLSKIIERQHDIVDWNSLTSITKSEKTYGVLNIALLDHLFITLPNKGKVDEVVETAYLLDLINDGITKRQGYVDYLPANLDVNATLINILNNDLDIEDRRNKLPAQTVKRACLDLVSNGGYDGLSWPAKQVICRIILDTIGNSVYRYDNMNKLLSDENKIYLRLMIITLKNQNLCELFEQFR